MNILRKINFSSADTLYVLGDVVDRGSDGIKVVLNLAARDNIITLKGNCDHEAFILLKTLTLPTDGQESDKFAEAFRLWLSDGGITTYESYTQLCADDKKLC